MSTLDLRQAPTEPVVLEERRQGDRAVLVLLVPETLFYFRGHFPGYAILPGVVQLDWAIRYARRQFGIEVAGAPNIQLKFHRPIRPRDRLVLTLTCDASRRRLTFSYREEDAVRASGQVAWGMP